MAQPLATDLGRLTGAGNKDLMGGRGGGLVILDWDESHLYGGDE